MKKRRINFRKRYKKINWDIIDNMMNNNSTKKNYVDSYRYCQYNQEVSEKFYKFLELMLNIPFEFYNDSEAESFSLNFNLNDYFNNSRCDDYLNVIIKKDTFKINKNYIDICGYYDSNIYNLFQDKIMKCYELKSKQELDRVIDEVLDVIPAIGREYKIDGIFND